MEKTFRYLAYSGIAITLAFNAVHCSPNATDKKPTPTKESKKPTTKKPTAPQPKAVGKKGKAMKITPGWKTMAQPDWYTGDATPWKTKKGIAEACERVKKQVAKLRESVVNASKKDGSNTLENTLWVLNTMDVALDTGTGWTSFIGAVHPDKEVREHAQTCKKALSKLANDIALDQKVYQALVAVPTDDLDTQAKRYIKKSLRAFRRSGVDRNEATRTQLKKMHERMVAIQQEFGKTIREDTRSVALDPAQLKGLPADYIKAHPKDKKGKVTITTNYPDFYPFQTYGEDTAARKALYQAFMSRGYPKNPPRLKELLELRYKYAKLLGFDNWAAYTADDKMVKSAEAIDAFIKQLTTLVRPRNNKDVQVLLARKKKDDPKAATIDAFDRFYYVNKVRKEQYDFDSQAARAYFAYPKVKQGILDLFAELFSISFVPLKNEPVWHPDVEAFAVESEGKRLGKVFFDMHPREGKYKHAAVFPMQVGLAGAIEPMCTLVCNFPKATKDNAGLMEHTQVVTFFHEFGHAVHHLLGQNARWASLSGFNVEWDFVETPSQILEEWAWDPGVLARFAKHTKTGKSIPADLVKRMRAANEFGKGLHVMRQIFYTAYSFYIHNRDPKGLDLEAFTESIMKKYSPFPRLKGSYVYANFGHLMGYSSMYYTYQWSLVIAKDLFTRFQKEGMLNPAVAKAYRSSVLSPGGTLDANDLVKNFLNRAYTLKAYKTWLTQE
jgi:thimet oligopeptidase